MREVGVRIDGVIWLGSPSPIEPNSPELSELGEYLLEELRAAANRYRERLLIDLSNVALVQLTRST